MEGKLVLEYRKTDNHTKIIKAENIAPLKVQRPFYPEGKNICHTFILNTAGGIVGTDNLKQSIILHNNSQVLITSASAGKVYRSNGKQAKQDINISIDKGGCLELLPQENIIFNGAIYRQNIKVELGSEAKWLGWEINRFGRTARGEKFLAGEWLSSTEIWRQGKPLWIDKQSLWGSQSLWESPNSLSGKPVVGTLSWVFAPVKPDLLLEIGKLWDNANTEGEMGVTQLLSGLVCRYRGNSTSEAKKWFTDIWKLLRVRYNAVISTGKG